MKLTSVDLETTKRFSKLFTDYIKNDKSLNDLFGLFPTIENFQDQIDKKKFPRESREILTAVLTQQYKDLERSASVDLNIRALADDKTYTVTTGHQLNIFTGPLYFIYKIVTVVNTCVQLKAKYPQYNFVPVYWMASEDHDFDEISYFWLNNKKYKWESDEVGAVGHFNPSGLLDLCDSVPGIPSLFKEAYGKFNTLAEAVRCYVNTLFGKYGLVVVDADSQGLKRQLIPVIEDDIFMNTSYGLVNESIKKIQQLSYSTQVNPREINFFYLEDQLRERIEKRNESYSVLNTEFSWDKDELQKLIHDSPEKFSPNVVLRPLYQEIILPNLAYVGGPSEVAYWFQLKSVFDHYNVTFPLLMPRNFGAIIKPNTLKKIEKIGFDWLSLFLPQHELEKKIALLNSDKQIKLNGQQEKLMELFDGIKRQAKAIDKTLVAHVEAQAAKTKSKLNTIEKKFVRAEKRNHSEKISQLDAVMEALFPASSLQERRDNFMNFYVEDPTFIDKLISTFDPFDYRFHILLHGQQTNPS